MKKICNALFVRICVEFESSVRCNERRGDLTEDNLKEDENEISETVNLGAAENR